MNFSVQGAEKRRDIGPKERVGSVLFFLSLNGVICVVNDFTGTGYSLCRRERGILYRGDTCRSGGRHCVSAPVENRVLCSDRRKQGV